MGSDIQHYSGYQSDPCLFYLIADKINVSTLVLTHASNLQRN